jgi:hypothetical protein
MKTAQRHDSRSFMMPHRLIKKTSTHVLQQNMSFYIFPLGNGTTVALEHGACVTPTCERRHSQSKKGRTGGKPFVLSRKIEVVPLKLIMEMDQQPVRRSRYS